MTGARSSKRGSISGRTLGEVGDTLLERVGWGSKYQRNAERRRVLHVADGGDPVARGQNGGRVLYDHGRRWGRGYHADFVCEPLEKPDGRSEIRPRGKAGRHSFVNNAGKAGFCFLLITSRKK